MTDAATVVTNAAQSIDNNPILGTIVLCGLMGLVGQGIRAAVGLKSSATLQAQQGTQQSAFDAAYFSLSLMIGFIAGVLGAFAINAGNIGGIDLTNVKTLLALMAFGYAGTDFIENAFTNLLPSAGFTPWAPPKPAASADGSPPSSSSSGANPSVTPSVADLDARLATISSRVDQIHSAVNPTAAPAAQPLNVPGTNYPVWALKRDVNLGRTKYLQHVTEGAQTYQLPIAVILAIGSKESQWGLALRPQGPAGTGDFTRRDPARWGHAMPTDGLGWGRGLMQIDWYSNDFAKTGSWRDARANVLYGCELLAGKIKKFTDAGNDEDTSLRCGVSAYNGMSGAHSSYANDVMARAAWIQSQGLDASDSSGAAAA
jgi:hypothetical protein